MASPSCIIVSLYNKSNCYCLPHWLLWLSRGHHVAYIMSSRRSSSSSSRHCHAPALSAAPARTAHSTWLASSEPPVRNLHKIMQNHAMRLVFVACPVKASLTPSPPLSLSLWYLCMSRSSPATLPQPCLAFVCSAVRPFYEWNRQLHWMLHEEERLAVQALCNLLPLLNINEIC